MEDWIGVILILLGGLAALVGLLSWSTRVPFLVPPYLYDQMTGHGASRKPFAELMNLVPILAGIAVVTVCAALYFWWMSRPCVIRAAARREPGP
jgi:hypothetical protein